MSFFVVFTVTMHLSLFLLNEHDDDDDDNHNEQFFHVGLLDRASISLGLALSPPSTSVSSDFMVQCKCIFKIILTSLYLVECLAWWIGPLPGALTN